MSDADPASTPLLHRLTARERYAILAAGALGLAVGQWLGLLLVPDAALAVPTETTPHGSVDAIYQPVPEVMLLATTIMLGVAVWAVWQAIQVPGGRWTVDPTGGDQDG